MLVALLASIAGCSKVEPPSASEEKLNSAETEAALKRRGYIGTPGPNNTNAPRENGNVVAPVDVEIPAGARYPDYLEQKSGHTTDTTYITTSPVLADPKYAISKVTFHDDQYRHLVQTRRWEVYVAPEPDPYVPPYNPDNREDDWTPPPVNPDNREDDWGGGTQVPVPQTQPENPDNREDDWGALLLNSGILGGTAHAAPGGLEFAVLALTCPNFTYFERGGTTYMTCGNTTYMEYVATETDVDRRANWERIDFSVNGNGGTTNCNLTVNNKLDRKSGAWAYDPKGLELTCDADWAETTTNEKGKPVSLARSYANDLSRLIQGQ